MKGKDFMKAIIFLLFLFFLSLYIGQATGYYEFEESKKTTLTKDAITRFEEDLKAGKELEARNYLQEEKNYNNRASRMGLRISNLIEGGFNKAMAYLFNKIGEEINSK